MLNAEKEVVGVIIQKNETSGSGPRGQWEKVSFKIEGVPERVTNGVESKNMSLSIFKDEKNAEMIESVNHGDLAKFKYYDKKGGLNTYHNIVSI